jgi:hypothetical protein
LGDGEGDGHGVGDLLDTTPKPSGKGSHAVSKVSGVTSLPDERGYSRRKGAAVKTPWLRERDG